MAKILDKDSREWEDYYKEIAEPDVSNYHKNIDYDNPFLRILSKHCRDHAAVLDVGCGKGGDSFALCKIKKTKPSLIDVSPTAIDFAKKLFNAYDVMADIRVSDATELPFKDQSFDLVFSEGVLAHIQQYKKALNEMRRVCKSGGKIVLTVPNKYRIDSDLYVKAFGYTYTQQSFSFNDLNKICKDAGLAVVARFGLDNFFFTPSMFLSLIGAKRFENGTTPSQHVESKQKTRVSNESPLARLNRSYLYICSKINRLPAPSSLKLLLGVVAVKK